MHSRSLCSMQNCILRFTVTPYAPAFNVLLTQKVQKYLFTIIVNDFSGSLAEILIKFQTPPD